MSEKSPAISKKALAIIRPIAVVLLNLGIVLSAVYILFHLLEYYNPHSFIYANMPWLPIAIPILFVISVLLFDFLRKEIEGVHEASGNLAELPLRFLLRLCKVMGYSPEDNYSDINGYFSLQECRFQPCYAEDAGFMNGEESVYLHRLLCEEKPVPATRSLRSALLKRLVAYLQMHNEQIRKIDSLEILASVLH